MSSSHWSKAEKQIARHAFDIAMKHEQAEIVATHKSMAVQVQEIDDVWPIEDYLRQTRHHLQGKYYYHHFDLLWRLAGFKREGRMDDQTLASLAEDKLEYIRDHLERAKRYNEEEDTQSSFHKKSAI